MDYISPWSKGMKTVTWIEEVSTPFNFIGQHAITKEYQDGDVVLMNDEIYVFHKPSEWIPLGQIEDVKPPQRQVRYSTNCKNCGAPLHSHKCPYCGTEDYGY